MCFVWNWLILIILLQIRLVYHIFRNKHKSTLCSFRCLLLSLNQFADVYRFLTLVQEREKWQVTHYIHLCFLCPCYSQQMYCGVVLGSMLVLVTNMYQCFETRLHRAQTLQEPHFLWFYSSRFLFQNLSTDVFRIFSSPTPWPQAYFLFWM